jgi:DNA-directed RNA polymerase specialized sigma24 family protein
MATVVLPDRPILEQNRTDLASLNDPRLERLIRADRAESEREVERLFVEMAQPLITAILARYSRARGVLGPADVEDISATISLRLITKLRGTATSADDAIQDFEKYLATLIYNVINDHLRKAFPARTRLKNRLRYACLHDPRLALWSTERELLCGLEEWNGARTFLTEVPIDAARASRVILDGDRPADSLVAILERAGQPIVFDAMVSFTATAWQVVDVQTPEKDITPRRNELGTADRLEMRQYLAALWTEIRELRPMQRKALLLNLRSGESANVISLLILTGVAPFDDVAAALEMTPAGLAAIWNDLPFDDNRIAAILDVPRQKVINLRKSARERLSRRMDR